MPEISRFYGIIIRMYFNEHNPPHFHADYQGFEITVTIKDGIVEGKMPKRALKLIFEWLNIHKEALLENWSRAQDREELFKVEPLR